MKNSFLGFKFLWYLALFQCANLKAQDTVRVTPYFSKAGNLMHDIKLGTHYLITDKNNHILPWYSADLGESYDYVLNNLWKILVCFT